METHAFHAFGIYYEAPHKLWDSQYAPTTLDWATEGMKLPMDTDLPIGDSATLKIASGNSKTFTLALRRPYWATNGFTVKVNGKAWKSVAKPDNWIEINRKWKAGDTVELVLPKTLRKEPLHDNPNRMAIMWGPLVLAADLGPELDRRSFRQPGFTPPAPAPALITDAPVNAWLKPVSGKAGVFRTANVGLKEDVDFAPFYEMPKRRYAIYWDVFTPSEWAAKSAAYEADQEKKKKLEAATVAFAQPGQMQTERDFNQQGEESTPVQLNQRYGRVASKWFSFDVPVEPATPMKLIVTFSNEIRGRGKGACDVLVDGKKLGEQTADRRTPEQDPKFWDVEYPLPSDLVNGKQKVTVRFQAQEGAVVPGVFGIRVVRADVAR